MDPDVTRQIWPNIPLIADGFGEMTQHDICWIEDHQGDVLPSCLTAIQRKSMVFVKMTSYLMPRKGVPSSWEAPPPGNYPFYVLCVVPEGSDIADRRFKSQIAENFFAKDGAKVYFRGGLVGTLNTRFVRPGRSGLNFAGMQIPVIAINDIRVITGGGTSQGLASGSATTRISRASVPSTPNKSTSQADIAARFGLVTPSPTKGKGKALGTPSSTATTPLWKERDTDIEVPATPTPDGKVLFDLTGMYSTDDALIISLEVS